MTRTEIDTRLTALAEHLRHTATATASQGTPGGIPSGTPGDPVTARAPGAGHPDPRLMSIWEVTTWVLDISAEHLRRVLRAEPGLPQGRTAGAAAAAPEAAPEDGRGMRWFTPTEVARLRTHFIQVRAGVSGRRNRGDTGSGAGLGAESGGGSDGGPGGGSRPVPLVVLAGPLGRTGRTTALLHLAIAATLAGRRVLAIDADPGARLTQVLAPILTPILAQNLIQHLDPNLDPNLDPDMVGTGAGAVGPQSDVLGLFARGGLAHLRRMNTDRLDRGEAPLAADPALTMAAGAAAAAGGPLRATAWPGLDLIGAGPGLLLADLRLAAWRRALRGWQPAGALRSAVQAVAEGAAAGPHDLVICDTGPGLGPLALSLIGAADLVVVPMLSSVMVPGADRAMSAGLAALATALQTQRAEDQLLAEALGLGQAGQGLGQGLGRADGVPARLALLPAAQGAGGAGGGLSVPGGVLLLPGLPFVPEVAAGQVAHLYDLAPRGAARIGYAPRRDACEAAWAGLAGVLGL